MGKPWYIGLQPPPHAALQKQRLAGWVLSSVERRTNGDPSAPERRATRRTRSPQRTRAPRDEEGTGPGTGPLLSTPSMPTGSSARRPRSSCNQHRTCPMPRWPRCRWTHVPTEMHRTGPMPRCPCTMTTGISVLPPRTAFENEASSSFRCRRQVFRTSRRSHKMACAKGVARRREALRVKTVRRHESAKKRGVPGTMASRVSTPVVVVVVYE